MPIIYVNEESKKDNAPVKADNVDNIDWNALYDEEEGAITKDKPQQGVEGFLDVSTNGTPLERNGSHLNPLPAQPQRPLFAQFPNDEVPYAPGVKDLGRPVDPIVQRPDMGSKVPGQKIPYNQTPNDQQAPEAISTVNNGASAVFTGKDLGIEQPKPNAIKDFFSIDNNIQAVKNFFSPKNNLQYLKNIGKAAKSSSISALSNMGAGFEEQAIKLGTAIKGFSQNPDWQKYWNGQLEGSKENLEGARKFGAIAEPLTGAPGEFLGSMIPFVATAAVSIMLKNPTVATGVSVGFGEMGYGEGVKAYDDFKVQSGQPIDEAERTGAAALYAVAYTAPIASYLGKMMPKNLIAKAVQGAMASNPEATAVMGREIFDNFARKSPTLAKQLVNNIAKSAGHGVASMEVMQLSKLAVDDYLIGKDVKLKDYLGTMQEAAVSGLVFGTLTAPFATIAQRSADMARREQQGFVTLSKDANGKPVEIIIDNDGNNIGLTPSGKQVKLTQEQIDNSFTLTTEDFNSAITTFGQTKQTPPDIERTAYMGRTSKMLDNVSDENGMITVPVDPNTEILAVLGRQDGKLMGVSKAGEVIEVEDIPITKVNKGMIWSTLRDAYDQQHSTPQEKYESRKALESATTPEEQQAAQEKVDSFDNIARQQATEVGQETEQTVLDKRNTDTGQVITATHMDGTVVDVIGGDPTDPNAILTIRTEDGTTKQVSHKELTDINIMDAGQLATDMRSQAENDVLDRHAQEMAYSPDNNPQPGQPITINGIPLTIQAIDPASGMVTVADEKGQPTTLSMDQVRDAVQDQLDTEEQMNGIVGVQFDADGTKGTATGLTPDGQRVIYELEDGTEGDMSLEYFNQIKPQQEEVATQEQEVSSLGGEVSTLQPEVATLPAESQEQAPVAEQVATVAPVEAAPIQPRENLFPKDKKGNIDYKQITDPTVYADALHAEFGNDDSKVVSELLKDASDVMKKAKSKGNTIDRMRSVKQAQVEIDKIEAIKLSIYKNKLAQRENGEILQRPAKAEGPVQESEAGQKTTAAISQPKAGESQPSGTGTEELTNNVKTKNAKSILQLDPNHLTPTQKRSKDLGDYLDLDDYILRSIAEGQKFLWKSTGDGRRGLDSEMGLRSETERRKRISITNSTDGTTPEEWAEHIDTELRDQGLVPLGDADLNDIRGRIISIATSLESPSQAMAQAESRHAASTEKEDAYYQNQDAVAQQAEQSDRAEHDLYREVAMQDVSELTDVERIAVDNLFIDQTNNTFDGNNDITNGIEPSIDTRGSGTGQEGNDLVPDGRGITSGTQIDNSQLPNEADQGTGNGTVQGQTPAELQSGFVEPTDGQISGTQPDVAKADPRGTEQAVDVIPEHTPEEQQAATNTATRIDSEIADHQKALVAKQEAYDAKKRTIGKAYAQDNQTDIFETAKLVSGLYDENEVQMFGADEVGRDLSGNNIASILAPMRQEVENITTKLQSLHDGKEKAIQDAVEAVRLQTSIQTAEAEVNIDPTEAQKEAKETLEVVEPGFTDTFKDWQDNNGNVSDLVPEIEAYLLNADNANDLQNALDTWQDEYAYDQKLSGRGDMDSANDALVAAVEKHLELKNKESSQKSTTSETENTKKFPQNVPQPSVNNDKVENGEQKSKLVTVEEDGKLSENLNEPRAQYGSNRGFTSTVENALETIIQEKGTPEQFKAMLLKNGAKQAEMDWMGFDDAFKGKSVTKTDVQKWIDENRIEVEEVQKGEVSNYKESDIESAKVDYNGSGSWIVSFNNGHDDVSFPLSQADDKNEAYTHALELANYDNAESVASKPKYSQYTVPGGTDYRELLLTMPENWIKPITQAEYYTQKGYSIEQFEAMPTEKKKELWVEWTKIADAQTEKNRNNPDYKSSHFDERNILAHVRFDTREINGEKVLFLQEIQSDWAQEGKKKGFKSKEEPAVNPKLINDAYSAITSMDNLGFNSKYEASSAIIEDADFEKHYDIDPKYIDTLKEWRQYQVDKAKAAKTVPDMPFKKTDQWINLAIRRMIRYAAENGFDRIAWTNGEMQAERYDLSKSIDDVQYYHNPKSGNYSVMISNKGKLVSEETKHADELESYIGKELAQKIINGEGEDITSGAMQGNKRLSGLDLKVGGAGMKAFYDAIVPAAVSKLSKPFGAKVENINLDIDHKPKNEFAANAQLLEGAKQIDNATVQSLPVTDSMKDSIMDKMFLFEPEQNYESGVTFDAQGINERKIKYVTQDGKQLTFSFDQAPEAGTQAIPGIQSGTIDGGLSTGSDVLRRETDPTTWKQLDRLKPGESALVERMFTEQKAFDFTGSEKIESINDVVYIFKNLEDYAIENTFFVLLKDGKPTILHVGMGTMSSSVVDMLPVFAAEHFMDADKIYLVHNHPSGKLFASDADYQLYNRLKAALGQKIQDGIIINLKTGHFCLFDASASTVLTKGGINNISNPEVSPVKVYKFDKNVFDKNFDPRGGIVRNSKDIASFVSSHRLGDRKKISILLINNSGKVVANLLTDHTDLSNNQELAEYITFNASKFSAVSAIAFGDFRYSHSEASNLRLSVKRASAEAIALLDIITSDGNFTKKVNSAADSGVLEPASKYGIENASDMDPLELAKRISEKEQGFAEPEPGYGSNGKPLLTEAEKDRNRLTKMVDNRDEKIRKHSADIAAIRKSIRDNKNDVKRNSDMIIKYAKENVTPEIFDAMQKMEYNEILSAINKATRSQELDLPFAKLTSIIDGIAVRRMDDILRKLLTLKIVDQEGHGVSIAKNVDEHARILMQKVKDGMDKMEFLPTSKEMEDLVRERKEVNELLRGTPFNEDLIAKRKAINKRIRIVEEARKAESRNLYPTFEAQVEAQIQSYQGRDNYTQEDKDEIVSLNALKHVARVLTIDADIFENEAEIERVNTIKRGTEGYATKQKQILTLETQKHALQIEKYWAIHHAIDRLGSVVENGRDSLIKWNEDVIARRKAINTEFIGAIKGKRQIKKLNVDRKDTAVDKVNALFKAPLWSFDWALRHIDINHPAGKGPTYTRFMRSEDGISAASDNYNKGLHNYQDAIDKASVQMFGKPIKAIVQESSKVVKNAVHISVENSYTQKIDIVPIDMSKGQAMYVYMVWQMDDGRAHLLKQGYDESSIEEIEDFIGPKYIQYAEWVQDDYLPQLRKEKYNPTHIKMFGTSMAERDHYFPLKIDGASIPQKIELGEDRIGTPTTITGNIRNRTNNLLPIDTEQNAFQVLEHYGKDMEMWNAYAQVTADLNGILGSKFIKEQMKANEHGSFNFFKDAAAIAVHQFENTLSIRKPWQKPLALALKRVATSKISFRLNTAMKQVLSLPAFLDYSMHPRFIANLMVNMTTITKDENGLTSIFTWAKNNLPSYKERVTSGFFGNEILQYEKSHSKIGVTIDKFASFGMKPNKAVDAYASAVGAKAVYDYAMHKYRKLSPEMAKMLAKFDAEAIFNETQQSSEAEYLSAMQADGELFSRAITTYMNNNIAYYRKLVDGIDELGKNPAREIKALEEQYRSEGRDDYQEKAKRDFYRAKATAVKRIALFGFGMQMLWAVGGIGIAGLGGDPEKKKKAAIRGAITGPLQGMPLVGDMADNLIYLIVKDSDSKKQSKFAVSPIMLAEEVGTGINNIITASNQYGLSPEVGKAVAKMILTYGGVNAETFENIMVGALALADADKLDTKTLGFLYLINLPASQRKEMAEKMFNNMPQYEFTERMLFASKAMTSDWSKFMLYNTPRTQKEINRIGNTFHQRDWTVGKGEEAKFTAIERKVNAYKNKISNKELDPIGLASVISRYPEMASMVNDKQFKETMAKIGRYTKRYTDLENAYLAARQKGGSEDESHYTHREDDGADYTAQEYRQAVLEKIMIINDLYDKYNGN